MTYKATWPWWQKYYPVHVLVSYSTGLVQDTRRYLRTALPAGNRAKR